MNEQFKVLIDLIRQRRSISPEHFIQKDIPIDLLKDVLSTAIYAPNHKKTQPWRFKILRRNKKNELSVFLSNQYKLNTKEEDFNEIKFRKAGEKAILSNCVILLCLERSPSNVIPEWEETAALACAVQNIWLSCTALGIGAYWSTPSAIHKMKEFITLQETEECLGIFYCGWSNFQAAPYDRKSVSDICSWYE